MIFNMTSGGAIMLNFDVIGSKVQPINPEENTIWVETDIEISSWTFDSQEPKNPIPNMVWIKTGASSSIDFNALQENSIQIYLIGIYQYIDGEWVRKPTMVYQNGEWTKQNKIIVPNKLEYGSEAWTQTGTTITATDNNTIFKIVTSTDTVKYCIIKMDVSGFSQLKLSGSVKGSYDYINVYAGIFSNTPTYDYINFVTGFYDTLVANGDSLKIDGTYDISAIKNGECYIGFAVLHSYNVSGSHTATFDIEQFELS